MKEIDRDFLEMTCCFHVVEMTSMRGFHPLLFCKMYFVLKQFSFSFNTLVTITFLFAAENGDAKVTIDCPCSVMWYDGNSFR